MKIRLRSTGGIGGLSPPPGEIDTGELEPELAERAERLLQPEAIAAAGREPNERLRDAQSYELTVLPEEGEELRHYQVDQGGSAAELMQLLHDLMAEIHRRKAGR